jgi:3-carboxy-cis,cis-muconate cycloisomerase
MPHKRNPVASMIALAAAGRTPHSAAALLSAMGQQHERGLGNWQAELAEWPSLFLSAHGALAALLDAISKLTVDPQRMRANIDALHELVYAEALAGHLGGFIGRPEAHAMVETLSRSAVTSRRELSEVALDAINLDARLRGKLDMAQWPALFDALKAAAPAAALARTLAAQLKQENPQ